MRVLQTPATLRNALFLPYKEGVAGSNPASPTSEKVVVCRRNAARTKGPRSTLQALRIQANRACLSCEHVRRVPLGPDGPALSVSSPRPRLPGVLTFGAALLRGFGPCEQALNSSPRSRRVAEPRPLSAPSRTAVSRHSPRGYPRPASPLYSSPPSRLATHH